MPIHQGMSTATANRLTSLALGILFLLALCLIPPAAMGSGEFEPNEDPETAYGPLASGVTYAATLEDGEDFDYYFFYVTGSGASPVGITITDTTVDGDGLYAELFDAEEETIDEIEMLGEESDFFEEDLAPGVYYIAVETALFEQFNETYEIRAEGSGGAFSPQNAIQTECRRAGTAISKARVALKRAQRRLRRAIKRHRPRRAKAAARRAIRTARARLKAANANAELLCPTPLSF